MSEITTLPFIDTIEGRPKRPIAAIVDDTELVGGFILRELDPFSATSDTLHWLHRSAAARLLLHSGVLPDVRQISEYPDGAVWSGYTFQHLDGLTGRFYQVNTPKVPETVWEAAFTTMSLVRYVVQPDEHARIMKLAEKLQYPGANITIGFNQAAGEHPEDGFVSPALVSLPLSSTTATYGCDSTVVFPNGYNALPGSTPQDLWVHSFQSSKDMSGLHSSDARIVIMSRIADPQTQAA